MLGILAYIDPGSGFVFLQNTSLLWGIILGLIGGFSLFFRLFFKSLKKFIWIFFILLAILIIGGLIMHRDEQAKKVIILGIDAMDPNITEQLIRGGRLPNFSYLKTEGTYSHLATTVPAESAVAWASFATGLNPGSHGIFDFIMRNPEDYLPYLSLNEAKNVPKTISFGRIRVPIMSELKILSRQKGRPFWNILFQHRIPSYIYFCPNTFPAQPLLGKLLSGMGVPDIYGIIGRLSFYTTKILSEEDKDSRGKIVHIESKNNMIETEIYGPKVASGSSIAESTVPLRIIFAPDKENISLEFQGNRLFLKEGNWSDWQKISFKIGPFKKAYGIVRFYLKSIKPEFELYASPINFDPEGPLFPISYPYNYSKRLAKKIGLYYTQGMPHDTWALTEDRLDEKAFLEHVDNILEEKSKILFEELKGFKRGVFFFYVETLDTIQHMFWRYLDSRHPLYEENSLYKDTIFKYYEKIDRLLGEVLKILDKDTTLIVLSDHGFSSFRKSVHLNRWLLENGYLSLKGGIKKSDGFFENVDWSKTKAYALGFGGIYLNRIGREHYGIVKQSELQNLKQDIAIGLSQLRDPQTNEMVVENVYAQEEIFQGPYINDAPDLFVGFNKGFRASWQTALGGVPDSLINDNRNKWGGDHLVDPGLVLGVIFINKKVELENPSIMDIAPTILNLFGIAEPNQMQGKLLFKDKSK